VNVATKKIEVPDGKGGWVKAEGAVHTGAAADKAKQEAAMKAAFIDEAGTLTERIMKFDVIYIKDFGLSKEHRAFAAALYCVNLRETYPDGPEAFDAIAAEAGAYYDANVSKVKA
jgi:hypothetical protein